MMNNLYEIEYGIKKQNEVLKKVDKTAWKMAKIRAKKAARRHA